MSEIDNLISDLLRRDRKNWKFHFFVPTHLRDQASSEFDRNGLTSPPAEGHSNFSDPLCDKNSPEVAYYGASGWWPADFISGSTNVLSAFLRIAHFCMP